MTSGQAQPKTRRPQPGGTSLPGRNWDATKTDAPVELLQSGFQLAYFILQDRSSAVNVLIRALEKVRVQSRRQMKRLYWRDKHDAKPVRRIARSDMDLLQWLIMFECEEDERAQERAGPPPLRSMVIRYVKHLVQITSALSSFYVNIGLSRLLHSYSTPEAQRIYETLTSRYLGPDEYRRAKSALMEKVSQRFLGFLKLAKIEHGELRFDISHDQEQWADVAADCLKTFTPWSTHGDCRQFMTVDGGDAQLKSAQGLADWDANELELRCSHILIEPECYSRLMKELAFDSPDTKLALPRFVMPEKHEQSGDGLTQPGHPPGLSQEDLDHIERQLAASDMRRRNIHLGVLKIAIDSVEYGRLDLTKKTQLDIGLEAGASIVEIRGEDERGDLLLATHVISYENDVIEASRTTVTLTIGKLKLGVTPAATMGQGPLQAVLSLNYQPQFKLTRAWITWRFRTKGPRIRIFALAGLAMVLIGWTLAGAFYSHKLKVLEQRFLQAHRDEQRGVPTAARAILSYRLTPDEQGVRGAGTAGTPEISLRLHPPAISLELPLSEAAMAPAGGYSAELKTFSGDQTLMTQNAVPTRKTDSGRLGEIVISADLLKADTYYTVHLHSSGRTDHFTFKVVDGR